MALVGEGTPFKMESEEVFPQLHSAGIWWLPGANTKINGSLDFSIWEGAILKTNGTLGYSLDKIEILLGVLASGQHITLLNGFRSQRRSSGGFPQETYYFNLLLVGVHLNSVAELEFEKIYARFTCLEEWLGISGFELSSPAMNVEVVYKNPPPVKIQLEDGSQLLFCFGRIGPTYTTAVQKTVHIEQRSSVAIHEQNTTRCP